MKKTYIIPELTMVQVESAMMIAGFNSTLDTTGGNGSNALVKGDRSSRETPEAYNVWNDDWSQ